MKAKGGTHEEATSDIGNSGTIRSSVRGECRNVHAFQPGMSEGDRVDNTEVLDSSETIKVEIVEIDGNRLITERENGDQLVFLVEGSPAITA
jgi:hypothetical protein